MGFEHRKGTMENLDIKDNWNRMADEYELFTDHEESYSNLIEWKAIKTILPELKNKSIVDLGCGTGRFSFLFESMNPRSITGIDLSEKMIEIGLNNAKRKKSIVKFVHGNIEDLSDMKLENIDFVFSSTTLHYIKNLNNIMQQINRILTSGGECILSVIHPVYSAYYPILHENRECRMMMNGQLDIWIAGIGDMFSHGLNTILMLTTSCHLVITIQWEII